MHGWNIRLNRLVLTWKFSSICQPAENMQTRKDRRRSEREPNNWEENWSKKIKSHPIRQVYSVKSPLQPPDFLWKKKRRNIVERAGEWKFTLRVSFTVKVVYFNFAHFLPLVCVWPDRSLRPVLSAYFHILSLVKASNRLSIAEGPQLHCKTGACKITCESRR